MRSKELGLQRDLASIFVLLVGQHTSLRCFADSTLFDLKHYLDLQLNIISQHLHLCVQVSRE
jgi:hypothetical protein